MADEQTDAAGPVTMLATPIRLDFEFTAGIAMSKNLHGYEQGKFIGQRCPKCKKVYVPSRGSCPTDGLPTDEIVELPNTGTVTTYCVVNVPFAGQSIGATSGVTLERFDEATLLESGDRAIQRPRTEHDARERFDVLGEGVAVLGPSGETGQDQQWWIVGAAKAREVGFGHGDRILRLE